MFVIAISFLTSLGELFGKKTWIYIKCNGLLDIFIIEIYSS
jgi:hypothetical protein